MYIPSQFNHPQHASALMREHPLATVIAIDGDGFAFAAHLPLVLEEEGGRAVRLLGHCARANPLAQHLAQRPAVLVSFLGPHAYMSPAVYDDVRHVPTWSYLAVQVRARAHLLDGHEAKDALLKQLIAEHESAYAEQWRGLDEDYTGKMLSAICAFELRIEQVQAAVKLNQHRPQSHLAMHAAYAQGTAPEQALARWMERLGLVPPARVALAPLV